MGQNLETSVLSRSVQLPMVTPYSERNLYLCCRLANAFAARLFRYVSLPILFSDRRLRQDVFSAREPEDTLAFTHWREAVRLSISRMWQGVQQLVGPRQTPPHAHRHGQTIFRLHFLPRDALRKAPFIATQLNWTSN